MKAIYSINFREKVPISAHSVIAPVTLTDATIDWAHSGSDVIAATLTLTNIPIKKEGDAILTRFKDLDERAFKVATFIANQVFVQTGIDAIWPEAVLASSPNVTPENSTEEQVFKTSRLTVSRSVTGVARILQSFDSSRFGSNFTHSGALASFAEGLRALSPFIKFEQSYKVVEHFFNGDGDALDLSVSQHCSPLDAKFTQLEIKRLRQLRNRSVHPKARHGTVNPEDLADVNEVQAAVPDIQRLARLLLNNPPPP